MVLVYELELLYQIVMNTDLSESPLVFVYSDKNCPFVLDCDSAIIDRPLSLAIWLIPNTNATIGQWPASPASLSRDYNDSESRLQDRVMAKKGNAN